MATKETDSSYLLIEKVIALKAVNLFTGTPENILVEVAAIAEEVNAIQNDILFEEGDQGDTLYIILSGEIRISRMNHTLAVLKQNDFFGELSLLDTETRSATATVISPDAKLLKIDQEDFYELTESRIEVIKGVLKTLCRRLRDLNEKAAEKL